MLDWSAEHEVIAATFRKKAVGSRPGHVHPYVPAYHSYP